MAGGCGAIMDGCFPTPPRRPAVRTGAPPHGPSGGAEVAMFRRGSRVRALRGAELETARRLALREPVANALAGARLLDLTRHGSPGAEFSLAGEEGAPEGLLWHGVNISPLTATDRALEDFGRYLAGGPRRASSVVGPRRAVERLWAPLGDAWSPQVREYRWSQPLLLADPAPTADPDTGESPEPASAGPAGLRPARAGEEAAVFPASVAMFREEVGMDPTRGDGGRSYGRRVADLVRAGRTYVVMEAGRVVFKADVGAVFGPVAQIHGVWVRPDRRSHGLGRAAMAELATLVRRDHAPQVSLYVNAYNEAARRAYAAAGYRQVGELSTILF